MENEHCSRNGNCNNTKDSVTLAVSEGVLRLCPIIFKDIPLSETIGELKVRVLNQMAAEKGLQDFRRIADPESMLFECARSVQYRCLSVDDNQILGEFISNSGYDPSYPRPIHLCLAPQWIRYLKKTVARTLLDDCPVDDDGYCCDDQSDYEYEYYAFPDVDNIVHTQRPKDDLPDSMGALRVVGKLQVNNEWPEVGYLGGLQCDLKNVVSFTTPAMFVVLVFSEYNLQVFQRHYCDLHNCYESDHPNKKMLCLLVTWDKFSYLFLRKLRNCIGSQVPIIAFTDCNVHQIDLLTFLDTPPQDLGRLYGWHKLAQDCADLGLGTKVVDIKWGGVKPSELPHLPFRPDAYARYVSLLGRVEDISTTHDMVCCFLKSRKKWPEEVQLFENHRYNIPLICINTNFRPCDGYTWEEYIPKKFQDKDWS